MMRTKNTLIAVCAFLSILSVSSIEAQTQKVHPGYQDGKIWFKIRNSYPAEEFVPARASGQQQDPMNLPFEHVTYLKGITSAHQITRLCKPFHAAKNSQILQRTYQLDFSDVAGVDDIIETLNRLPMIEYAEKVPYDEVDYTPNDPSFNSSTMWYLYQINAPQAWNYTFGSSSVVVATVDNAVEINHPDLSPAKWVNPGETPNNGIDDDGNGYIDDINGFDVADNDNDPSPPNSSFDHGTHVAGTTGAATDNSTGVASIGFGVSIMAVKSTTNSASPTAVTDGYAGIVYAAASGAHVINCSWGGTSSSTTAQNTITWAYNQGSLIIAAAGNSNTNALHYPSAYNNVIAVAATASGDVKAGFSNYGTWVDVSAPGTAIYSTVPFGNYTYMQGTSMATPVVSGLAGLIYSMNPGMTQADVENCIVSTAVNIDGINPSYSGQLGSGRIDAAAALSCASSTLNNPPVADFSGMPLNIIAGVSVSFTDLSVYNPTSWSWSFPGGTPTSFNGQSPPPIQYNTPGTYDVTLTVTNSNGNDVLTKPGYVVVNANTGCDTVGGQDPFNVQFGAYVYSAGAGGVDGFVAGCNNYGDLAKAEYLNGLPYNFMTGCWMWIGRGYSSDGTEVVPVTVWDGTGGTPGAVLHTENITMNDIMYDVNNNYLTYVPFSTVVNVPASGELFVGLDVSNLNWATDKDSLAIVTTQASMGPGTGWEQWSNSSWNNYSVGWGQTWSHYIQGFFSDVLPVSVASATPTTVCAGDAVTFDATGSNATDTMLWTFPGGTPYQSNSNNPLVYYNNAGTYWAYLEILGGSCAAYAVDSIQITVNALPSVNVTAGQDTICPSGSTVLTATGATTYNWSPATGLSCTTCANPTANPTVTTSYTCTGTTGACSRDVNFTLYVAQNPVADFIASDDTICAGGSVSLNGNVSQNTTGWSWTLTGGTPASSTSVSPSVTYNTAGTYTLDLTATNSCSGSDNTTRQLVVLPLPVASSSAAPGTLCEGQSVAYDASASTDASSYIWSFTGGSPSSSTNVSDNVVYATAGNYNYSVTVTGICGTDVSSGSVVVNPLPIAAYTTSGDTVCETGGVAFDASSSTGTAYSWSFAGGDISSSTAVNPSVSYSTAGSYPYTLYVTNSCGTDSLSGTVLVTAATPVASFTQSADTVCVGDSIVYDASGSTNASSVNWSFTGGNISSSTNVSETVFYLNPGSYSTTLVVDNSCSGLSDTVNVSIQVDVCGFVDEFGNSVMINSYYSKGQLFMTVNGPLAETVHLTVFNSLGQSVRSWPIEVRSGKVITLPVSDLASGVYYMSAQGKELHYVRKFVKE